MKIIIRTFLFLFIFGTLSEANASLVVQNLYFPKPGKAKAVYQLRLKASSVITKLGLPKGRVLTRKKLTNQPYVMWQCEFKSEKDRSRFVGILKKSKEFSLVERNMGKLIVKFERITWVNNG